MKKSFAFDTNCFIDNPNVLDNYRGEKCIIPIKVIEELDNLKKNLKVGYQARKAIRNIKEAQEQGQIEYTKVENLSQESPDNIILSQIRDLDVILVTSDLNFAIKSRALEIETEEPRNSAIIKEDEEYDGFKLIQNVEDSFFDQFYSEQFVSPEDLGVDYYPNQFVILESYDRKRRVAYRFKEWEQQFVKVPYYEKIWDKTGPRNFEQNLVTDLLMDPDVEMVTIVGQAGSGKTILALAAGLNQVHERHGGKMYDKVIVSRPIQEMGKGIGFLPGTLEEKMRPWVQPIFDNLEVLARDKMSIAKWLNKGKIEIEALPYIRGRSINNAFIIIDEAQNLTPHEVKTILTRAGEDTKIIFTGDIEQIDNPDVNSETNGLMYAAKKLMKSDLTGHCRLIKGERSPLADLAAKKL